MTATYKIIGLIFGLLLWFGLIMPALLNVQSTTVFILTMIGTVCVLAKSITKGINIVCNELNEKKEIDDVETK